MTSSDARPGELYRVADEKLVLPTEKAQRTEHPRRPVVIVSGAPSNIRADWELVLGVPCSTNEEWNSDWCIPIKKPQGGATKDTWARVPLIQPVLKKDLQDRLGKPLPPDKLDDIYESLLSYMKAYGFGGT